MSALEKFLKVQRVREKQRLAELGHVNSVLNEEREKLAYLDSFLSEYTIQNTLVGKVINRDELQNQNKFVGHIVHAHHQKMMQLNKLSGISATKRQEFREAKTFSNAIEQRVAEQKRLVGQQKQFKEDEENIETYNYRNNDAAEY